MKVGGLRNRRRSAELTDYRDAVCPTVGSSVLHWGVDRPKHFFLFRLDKILSCVLRRVAWRWLIAWFVMINGGLPYIEKS